MNILIMSRHPEGYQSSTSWRNRLSGKGHNVNYLSFLSSDESVRLSDYDVVIAHPVKEDFQSLYEEANNRKDFKLIFFNTETLKNINPDEEAKNKNIFYEGFPSPLDLVEIVERG